MIEQKDQSSVPQLLSKFIDGLTKAGGAAACIIHDHQDPRFIPVRDRLSLIRDKAINIAMRASGITVRNVN